MWQHVPITARFYMGDGDDFPVFMNGGLSPFDIALRQLCCLPSKSISSAAEECTICCQRADRPLPKSIPSASLRALSAVKECMPSAIEQRAIRCQRAYCPPRLMYHPSLKSIRSASRNGQTSSYPFQSALCLSVVCLINTSLTFPLLLHNFSGEYTILPTYKVLVSSWLIHLFILLVSEITHDTSSPITVSWSRPLRNHTLNISVNNLKHP